MTTYVCGWGARIPVPLAYEWVIAYVGRAARSVSVKQALAARHF